LLLDQLSLTDVGSGYSDRELRCLNEARELLLTQLTPVPTIREVARAAGMKETALKKAFKAVFGETPGVRAAGSPERR
jgi:AraC-like DNA-binding protein